MHLLPHQSRVFSLFCLGDGHCLDLESNVSIAEVPPGLCVARNPCYDRVVNGLSFVLDEIVQLAYGAGDEHSSKVSNLLEKVQGTYARICCL